jgi:dihydrofolate synthase/folylpolyglutamate synthase
VTYNEAVDYLYSQLPEYQRVGDKAYKPGLGNSLALDALFDYPHRRYKTIHVGGTNGKGSTAHLLESILRQSGYKTGLYTSPHLTDFRERIRVNGEIISREFVTGFVETHRERFEPVKPSFFELTMEMAFLYFARREVDVAIVEVGLGGRLDSTNIIAPDLSVITNIGLDHVKQLGGTLPQIAAEKAGIIKPHTPVVIGEAGDTAVAQVFIDAAQSAGAPIVFAELYMNDFKAERRNAGWQFHASGYPELKGALNGAAQDKNARTALTAVEVLRETGYTIPKEAVYKGFAGVALTGRWQQLGAAPKIVCDIAHNAHGMRRVAEQLAAEKFDRLHIVFGMADDKDVLAALALLPRDAAYYFTKASVARALNEKTLARCAETLGLKGNCFGSVAEAIEAAKKSADKNDFIFIGGSSVVVADALTRSSRFYRRNTP